MPEIGTAAVGSREVRTADGAASAPEVAHIRERVIVSPCAGRFAPLPPEVFTTEGEWIEPGQVLGEINTGSSVEPVTSAFRGWMMGCLAVPGGPVRGGEALFWIRGC